MIAIVDCNSFYCSCERLFRPDLLHKPVVVLSNNDGCVISRSDEAKSLGIAMGVPYFQVKDLLKKNDIAVFSSNYNLYGDLSRRVMDCLRYLSSDEAVEVYSVDEAFIDLDKFPITDYEKFSREMKATVEQWTGISVSIGVAPTKTLAKLANNIAKKNKKVSGCVTVLQSREQQKEALETTRVGDLWGVGRAYAEKLEGWGILTGWQLATLPEEWARKNMGGVVGSRLIRELRGIPSIDLKEELVEKKMIATTRMFGNAVSDIQSIREAVATYTSRAAEKLRRQYSAASRISVFVVKRSEHHELNFHRGVTCTRETFLPVATSSTQELIKPALSLVEALFEKGTEYKKAGVMLSGLVPDDSIQGNLFDTTGKNENRKLMDMIDNINFSQRDDILKFAASGTKRDWKMRQEMRSGRCSTRWEELRLVG